MVVLTHKYISRQILYKREQPKKKKKKNHNRANTVETYQFPWRCNLIEDGVQKKQYVTEEQNGKHRLHSKKKNKNPR